MPLRNNTANGGSSPASCSVSSARREVIENKLLDALSDDGTVAILASESDLDLFIESLGLAVRMEKPGAIEMQRDLMQLRDAAFPRNALRQPPLPAGDSTNTKDAAR